MLLARGVLGAIIIMLVLGRPYGAFPNKVRNLFGLPPGDELVYSATKAAALALLDGLRQELAGHIRVSKILPGFTDTAFSEHAKSPKLKEKLKRASEKFAMSPEAVARAVEYLLDQPEDVNVGKVTLRSTAQP